jgi:hypothetical protein
MKINEKRERWIARGPRTVVHADKDTFHLKVNNLDKLVLSQKNGGRKKCLEDIYYLFG